MITASAVLHQHQQIRRSVDGAGQTIDYLEAEQADADLALRLVDVAPHSWWGRARPHTQRLLREAERLFAERTAVPETNGKSSGPVWFTRRERAILRRRNGYEAWE